MPIIGCAYAFSLVFELITFKKISNVSLKGSPEELRVLHHWNCSKSDLSGLCTAWINEWCPCWWQGSLESMIFKGPFQPKSLYISFCDKVGQEAKMKGICERSECLMQFWIKHEKIMFTWCSKNSAPKTTRRVNFALLSWCISKHIYCSGILGQRGTCSESNIWVLVPI